MGNEGACCHLANLVETVETHYRLQTELLQSLLTSHGKLMSVLTQVHTAPTQSRRRRSLHTTWCRQLTALLKALNALTIQLYRSRNNLTSLSY